jgi:Domain of unknown function (DUF4129)
MRMLSMRARAAAVTLGLAATVAVVAMAARAPLSPGTPVNAQSAQGPTTALFMVLAGAGIVMLGAIVLVAFSGRRRKDDPPEHEPTRIDVPWIWKVVTIVLTLALGAALVLAAVTGTRSVQAVRRSGGQPLGGGAPPSPTRSTGASAGFTVPAWLPWTLLAIVAVALAVIALVLWLRRVRPEDETEQASAVHAAVEAAIGALDEEADPRRAVIAAYRAMQRALGERGVVRSPAEAPREYLERTLIASRATETEARTLTGLFEEARYSPHPISERVREAALSALHSLQGRLRADAAR